MPLYVNNQPIDDAQIAQEADRLRPQYRRVFADQPADEQEKQLAEWARENTIERALVAQAALADPDPLPEGAVEKAFEQLLDQHGGREAFFTKFELAPDADAAVRADVEQKLRIDRLLERIAATATPPTPEEARAHYDAHTGRYSNPELVHAMHIVRHLPPGAHPGAIQQEMDEVKRTLDAGADFATLARQHSDCPDRGGDLGYFARGQMVEEFEEVVFGMEPGQTSSVFMTPFGFHIAHVADRKPAMARPFDDVKAQIEKELAEERRQKALEEYIDRLKEQATIEERGGDSTIQSTG